MTRTDAWRRCWSRAGASAAALGLLVGSSPAHGQSMADRAAAIADGQIRMSYAAKPGVCGNGRNVSTSRHTDDWEGWCEDGPVRVVLEVVDGQVTDVDTYVGGRWRAPRMETIDLGVVSAVAAAEYLLSLARQSNGRAGKEAVFPATLADSAVVWPELLVIAKDQSRPRQTRKAAVFWVAQAAGDAATAGLEGIVDDDTGDRELRKSAVFALSQIKDSGVPSLIRIARTHRDPVIRKQAMFWLGQSEDPRAIALFEELLLVKR